MLIQPDSKALGDRKLSLKEELKRQYERTDKRLQQYRLPDHDHLKNETVRLGTPMLHTDLVRRVRALNPALWYEDSLFDPKNMGGLYYDKPGEGKACAAVFGKGAMPEYTIIHTDAADLPTGMQRGWRTVLVMLIQKGLLTRAQVYKHFGDPSPNERSARWHQQLHKGA